MFAFETYDIKLTPLSHVPLLLFFLFYGSMDNSLLKPI